MAVEQRFCVNHPERVAIGVCVETKKPICGECSTRYNGVNYSREGLEILRRRRSREAEKSGGQVGYLPFLLIALVMSAVMFLFYYVLGGILIDVFWPD